MTKATVFLLAAFVFALDQLSKKWAVSSLPLDTVAVTLIPKVLYFTRTSNTGSAFGLFPGSTMVLALAALIVGGLIVGYILRRRTPFSVVLGIGLALPLGGALGNFLDRARLSYVVDFIDLRIGSFNWPVFNVADSAICIGIVILAWLYMLHAEHTSSEYKTGLLDPEPSAHSGE